MNTWNASQLDAIGSAEEVELASRKDDGTLRSSTTIWIARDGDGLYVRGARGRGTVWVRRALEAGSGTIEGGGMICEVQFQQITDDALNARIDVAFSVKYQQYPEYVAPLLIDEARDVTLALVLANE